MSTPDTQVLVDVYSSFHSFGLNHDFDVMADAAMRRFGDRVTMRRMHVPWTLYSTPHPQAEFPKSMGKPGHVAIFIEHGFVADFLYEYKEKAFLINPEWFLENDKIACEALVNTILHKSRYFHASLERVLPSHRHVYTGFSSLDPGATVNNYTGFSHFRGLSWRRKTQELIEVWRQNPLLPLLRVHAYGDDIAVNTNAWVSNGNTQFYFGKFERDAYLRELAQGGIHLCTTRVEGYGHFVNEARAMSALTVVLDGAPMNEMITPETGILIPVSGSQRQAYGEVYDAETEQLAYAIERALQLPVAERERMGRAARALYEQQTEEFRQAFCDYLQPIVDDVLGAKGSAVASPMPDENGTPDTAQSNAWIFDNIYRNNDWGRASDSPLGIYSGDGSHDASIVSIYVDALKKFTKRFKEKPRAVDIGCGDFSVGSKIRHLFGDYAACDVSEVVLNHAREKYGNLKVDFHHLDASIDDLPDGDIIMIRQVLQHLDNQAINKIVRKIENKYKFAIITEHLPEKDEFPENMDKMPGPKIRMEFGSGVVLDKEPFNIKYKNGTEIASTPQFGGRIVTTLYEF